MAQTMIVAGGTWIALRKLRSIQATPAAIERYLNRDKEAAFERDEYV